MKKLLLALVCLVSTCAYAQDTVKRSNNIGNFEEQYSVLKSDKNIRQGQYQLLFRDKVMAAGKYDQNKKVGVWSYYFNDKLEQQYDHSSNKLISSISNPLIKCEIENTASGDSIINAVKVGGYAGFKYLLALTDFNSNVSGGGMIDHLISLDDHGKVTSWVATIKNQDGIKVVSQAFAELPADALQFVPASLNGQKVACTVSIHDMQRGDSPTAGGNDNGKPNMRGGRRGKN